MNLQELGAKLRDDYDNAPRGEQVAMIHLFGIDHSHDISAVGIREVVEQAGISQSYVVELNKGVKLSKYVQRRG